MSYETNNRNQKGSRRRTTDEEIKKQYVAVLKEPYTNGKLNEYEGRAGFSIREMDNKSYLYTVNTHALVIGGTRSGKGQTFVLKSIDLWSRVKDKQGNQTHFRPSMIVSDPKLENYSLTCDELKKRNYKVHILNLIDTLHSMHYNPLEIITEAYQRGDYIRAQQLTNALAFLLFDDDSKDSNNAYWNNKSTEYMRALIYAHTEDCVKMGKPERNNLYSITKTQAFLASHKELLDSYFNNRDDFSYAKLTYKGGFEGIAKDTLGTIFSNITKEIQKYLQEDIANLTADSTVNFYDIGFGDKPIALFLGFSETNKETHKLMTLFIEQMYNQLSYYADNLSDDGSIKRPVKFLLDEVGNMPKMEMLASNVTLAAGRNIQFLLILQSYSQLDAVYGKDTANIIKDNCANQIYLMTNGYDTAEYFSKLIGNETIVEVTRSGKTSESSKSFNENLVQKPLFSPNELMELPEGMTITVRTDPRRDLKGRDCVAYPIVNDVYRFEYAYKYLSDIFPKRGFNTIKDKMVVPKRQKLEDISFNSVEYTKTIWFIKEYIDKDDVHKIFEYSNADIYKKKQRYNQMLNELCTVENIDNVDEKEIEDINRNIEILNLKLEEKIQEENLDMTDYPKILKLMAKARDIKYSAICYEITKYLESEEYEQYINEVMERKKQGKPLMVNGEKLKPNYIDYYIDEITDDESAIKDEERQSIPMIKETDANTEDVYSELSEMLMIDIVELKQQKDLKEYISSLLSEELEDMYAKDEIEKIFNLISKIEERRNNYNEFSNEQKRNKR